MIGVAFIILGITSSWNVMVYIIIGLFCTGIAKALFIEEYFGGLATTAVVGIVGAFIGAYVPVLLGIHDNIFMSPLHCILSFFVSLSLLYLWNKIVIPSVDKQKLQ